MNVFTRTQQTKSKIKVNAMQGPEGKSKIKDRISPTIEPTIAKLIVTITAFLSELVIKLAESTGIISNPDTKIIPRIFTPVTSVMAVKIKRK